MTPYQFRPGPLSREDAAALTRLARMTRGNDGLMVRPPLSLVRQGSDGQAVLYLNTAAMTTYPYPLDVGCLTVTKNGSGYVTDVTLSQRWVLADGTVECRTATECNTGCATSPPPAPPPPPPTSFGTISGTVTTMPGDVPEGGRTVVEFITSQADLSDVTLGTYSFASVPSSSSGYVVLFTDSGESPSYRRDSGTWYAGVSCPVTTPGGTGWTVDVDWRIYAAGLNPDPTEPT